MARSESHSRILCDLEYVPQLSRPCFLFFYVQGNNDCFET